MWPGSIGLVQVLDIFESIYVGGVGKETAIKLSNHHLRHYRLIVGLATHVSIGFEHKRRRFGRQLRLSMQQTKTECFSFTLSIWLEYQNTTAANTIGSVGQWDLGGRQGH